MFTKAQPWIDVSPPRNLDFLDSRSPSNNLDGQAPFCFSGIRTHGETKNAHASRCGQVVMRTQYSRSKAVRSVIPA